MRVLRADSSTGSTTLNIQILEIAEIAQLGSALCRQKPDMLIVNPALLGMFSLQKIKSEAGCLPMKCIALQYSVTDSSTLKAYDQTISIYDTAEQIKEKLLQLHGSEAGGKEHDALSAREREIVVCVVKGMTNKQIAEKLCLSLHTVITHRRNIAGKLQIHSPAGLTIYAIVNKLVELSEIKETISDSDRITRPQTRTFYVSAPESGQSCQKRDLPGLRKVVLPFPARVVRRTGLSLAPKKRTEGKHT